MAWIKMRGRWCVKEEERERDCNRAVSFRPQVEASSPCRCGIVRACCSKHFSLASFSHNKAAVTTRTLLFTSAVACISLSLWQQLCSKALTAFERWRVFSVLLHSTISARYVETTRDGNPWKVQTLWLCSAFKSASEHPDQYTVCFTNEKIALGCWLCKKWIHFWVKICRYYQVAVSIMHKLSTAGMYENTYLAFTMWSYFIYLLTHVVNTTVCLQSTNNYFYSYCH